MLWDDLSIRTVTPARAGITAKPAMTVAATNISLASRRPDRRFMIAPCCPDSCWRHDVVAECVL
jgi:hypothetical protein